jgi:hypothetical protein
MSSGSDDASDDRAAVLAVLTDPNAGRSRLPQLLGLLDDADRQARLSAAWAISLVASECPDLADPIARRLLDRLARSETPEAAQTLRYVSTLYPDVVEAAATDVAEEAERQDRRRRLLELSRGFTRSDYTQRSDADRDVGRTRLPSEASSGNPRRSYREEGSSVGGAPSGPDEGAGTADADADAATEDEAADVQGQAQPSGDDETASADDSGDATSAGASSGSAAESDTAEPDETASESPTTEAAASDETATESAATASATASAGSGTADDEATDGATTESDSGPPVDTAAEATGPNAPESDDDPAESRRADAANRRGADGSEPRERDAGASEEAAAAAPDDADESATAAAALATGESAGAASDGPTALEVITAASRFDRLDIMDTATEGRYTDVYRTRAVADGVETGVALRLFRTPDGEAADFAASLADQLHNWHAISDHDGVVTLYEWGTDPSPWMATEYATETLSDRSEMGVQEAVWNARTLADTLSYAHQRGVVHAGIDPYDVVYQSPLTSVRREPLLGNFGLLDGMRTYFEPSSFLDPRYAAPEYFDASFGDVDHTTDIYQLGAVIYRLCTGRAPYGGSYEDVRREVMDADPPRPAAVNADVPGWLDEIVRKAMAKRKLNRYETATNLVGDLERATTE